MLITIDDRQFFLLLVTPSTDNWDGVRFGHIIVIRDTGDHECNICFAKRLVSEVQNS